MSINSKVLRLFALSLSLLMIQSVEAAKVFIEKPIAERASDQAPLHFLPIPTEVIDSLQVKVVAEYGTRVLVEAPQAMLDGFVERVREMGYRAYERPEFDRIRLNGYDFEAASGEPSLPESLTITDYRGEVGLYVVQFEGPPLKEWIDLLRSQSDIVRYFAENTFVVRTRPGNQESLRAIPNIHYVGVHQPAFKVHRSVLGRASSKVEVVVQLDEGQEMRSFESFFGKIVGHGVSMPHSRPFINHRAVLDIPQIEAVAARPEVLYIGPYGSPSPSDERHAMVLANEIEGPRPKPIDPNNRYGHKEWLVDKGFCATDTSPTGCLEANGKIAVFDTGLDSNACENPVAQAPLYDMAWGTCYDLLGITQMWTRSRHEDFGGNNWGSTRQDSFFCIPKIDEYGNDYDPCDSGNYWELRCYSRPTTGQGTIHRFNFSDSVTHGTSVSSLAAGSAAEGGWDIDGELYYEGWGMAPRARLVAAKVLYGGHHFGTVGYGCVVNRVTGVGARFSNHSWNQKAILDPQDPEPDIIDYLEFAQLMDSLVRDSDTYNQDFDEPMTIVFSAGNLQDLTSNPLSRVQSPANAKNVISVGASEGWEGADEVNRGCCDLYTTGAFPCHPCQWPGGTDDVGNIFGQSLRGTPDGRIKPDLVAPGTRLRTAHSLGVPQGGGHRCFGGTSAAAPLVTGSAFLIDAWYRENFPQENDPSPALLKAMLVAHAEDLDGGLDWLPVTTGVQGTPDDLEHSPSPPQGWGRVNLDVLIPDGGGPSSGRLFHDQDDADPSQGETVERRFIQGVLSQWSQSLQVVQTGQDVILVMAYTDAPGSVGATTPAVNNLNLAVIDGGGPGASRYYGNKFDTGNSYSRRFPGYIGWALPDSLNNVEVIRIRPNEIVNNDFTVVVSAGTLGGVGVPSLDGGVHNQDFALYIINAEEVGP